MSRVIVGYDQGRAIYRDEGPGYARIPGHRGELVVADARSDHKSRALDSARKFREKARAERAA